MPQTAEQPETETTSFANRPVWKSPRINGVQANIWQGKGENSPTVTIDKSWKDSEGKYQHTTSFYMEDLPNVNAVSTLATVEMARMQTQSRARAA